MAPESIGPGMFQAEAGNGNAASARNTRDASSLICSIGSLNCKDVICHGQSTRSTTTRKRATGNNFSKEVGMVTRIIVVLLVSLVHSSLGLAQGQQPKKVARVGYLSLGFPRPPSAPRYRYDEPFYQGLREVGYTEGKNLIVEYRYSEGNFSRFPELATELVSSKVDLIVAPSTPAIEAAKQATSTIP